jgi:Uma2 family endonuclease
MGGHIIRWLHGMKGPDPTVTPVPDGRDPSIARFSAARYQRMIEVGILTPEDKVELLENYVVLKMARNPPHDGTIDLIAAALPARLPSGWLLRTLRSIVLADRQPEPDCAIVRGGPRTYLTHHPGAADVGLIIEVAESSLPRDKTRIYARGGIPYYWTGNPGDQRIQVYTRPSGSAAVPAYGSFQVYQPGDAVPLLLDGVAVGTIPAADLLP